jgi:hypothetical protein
MIDIPDVSKIVPEVIVSVPQDGEVITAGSDPLNVIGI